MLGDGNAKRGARGRTGGGVLRLCTGRSRMTIKRGGGEVPTTAV